MKVRRCYAFQYTRDDRAVVLSRLRSDPVRSRNADVPPLTRFHFARNVLYLTTFKTVWFQKQQTCHFVIYIFREFYVRRETIESSSSSSDRKRCRGEGAGGSTTTPSNYDYTCTLSGFPLVPRYYTCIVTIFIVIAVVNHTERNDPAAVVVSRTRCDRLIKKKK